MFAENLYRKELGLSLLLAFGFLLPKGAWLDWSILYLFFISTFYRCLFDIKKTEFPSALALVVFLWVIVLFFAIIGVVLNQCLSILILGKPIRQLLLIWFFFVLISSVPTNRRVLVALYSILFTAGLNGFVVLLQYGLNSLGIDDSFTLVPGFDKSFLVSFRKPGLTSGYPIAGLLASLGVFVSIFLYVSNNNKAQLMFLGLISLISLIVTSRIALYLFLLLFVIWSVCLIGSARFRRIAYAFMGIVCVIFLLDISHGFVHHDTYNVMFEGFVNFSKSGILSTDSSDALFDSLRFEFRDAISFLFGNGLEGINDFGQTVDSGYQINLFGGGLLYAMVFYVLFVVQLIHIKKFFKERFGLLFFLTLAVLFAVSEVKGGVVFSRVVGDCLVLLFVSCATALHSSSIRCRNEPCYKDHKVPA